MAQKRLRFRSGEQVGFPDLVEAVKGSPGLAKVKFYIFRSGSNVTAKMRELLGLFDCVTIYRPDGTLYIEDSVFQALT